MPASERVLSDVRPTCDGRMMTESRRLRGIELRYVLTVDLFLHGPATITDMVQRLEWHGFDVARPAPKTVSDALRWERRLGRVHRLRRALYGLEKCPAAPSIGFIDGCWPCAQRRNRSEAGKTSPASTSD